MGGKHMRMCPGSTAGRQWVRIPLCPPSGPRDPGKWNHSFFILYLTAGKDRPPRRVKTLAMRKSATHDSRDRPATRRNWVGPGSNLGPEDGSIPSCATRLQKASIYLDSRQRPARRSSAPAVIRSICVVVAQQPSKLLGPVRVRYAAPAGRIRPFLPFG